MSAERFYHAGFGPTKGIRGAIVPLRRVLRRILRPMLVCLADQIDSLTTKLDEAEKRLAGLEQSRDRTSDQLQETIAFGWDYVAMGRRLAALEDQVAKLQNERATSNPESLRFPDSSAA